MNNCCIFVGNLTDDVKLSSVQCADGTSKNKAIIKLAVNGKRNDSTLFIEFTAWGGLADVCAKYLKKGSAASVRATCENNVYEKDGGKVYTYQFTAEDVTFISAGKTEKETNN